MIFTLFGFLAMILMNGSALPQLYKSWKTKKVKDLTIFRETMLLAGCSFYLIYGIYRKDPVIICSNIWAMTMFILLIYLQLKYKNENT